MPRSIQEIRQANGGLKNLSDEDIAKMGFSEFSSYYSSEAEYSNAVGNKKPWFGTLENFKAATDGYRSNLAGSEDLSSAALTSLGIAVAGSVICWVMYKKLMAGKKSETPTQTGRIWATYGVFLAVVTSPHQFLSKGLVDGAVASIALLIFYLAIGFILGWSYRKVRPAKATSELDVS